jgi:hypothetical protein
VTEVYKGDPNFEFDDSLLTFHVGERPFLLRNGASFRRFSSRINGEKYAPAQNYIHEVREGREI